VKALLLAAGYATRLHPLTLERPKPLLDVGGKPMLTHILERVVELPGLSEVLVVSNTKFHRVLTEWARDVDSPVPVRVLDDGSTDDSNKLGATGDVAFALGECPLGGEDLVVVGGDNLMGFDLRPLHAAFERHRTPLLAVRELEIGPGPSPYNEVTLDDDDRVVRFREKPDDPQSKLVAICLYFHPPEIGEWVRRYLDAGGNPDAPGHFVAWLVAQTPVHAARFEGEWLDIGSHEALAEARERFSGS
jgi:glucose-1-phosphate thymidylyltransferase